MNLTAIAKHTISNRKIYSLLIREEFNPVFQSKKEFFKIKPIKKRPVKPKKTSEILSLIEKGEWKELEIKSLYDIPGYLSAMTGNYIFFSNSKRNKTLYVGQAKNLKKRILVHLKFVWNKEFYLSGTPKRECRRLVGFYGGGKKPEMLRMDSIFMKVRIEKKQFERLSLEAFLIKKLKPSLNKRTL